VGTAAETASWPFDWALDLGLDLGLLATTADECCPPTGGAGSPDAADTATRSDIAAQTFNHLELTALLALSLF
jgi:hypothetical protein